MEKAEKRKSARYPAAYPLEGGKEEETKNLELLNISRGGAAFVSTYKIKPEERFNIKVYLKKKMYQMKAIVVHCTETGKNLIVGIKFLNPPEKFGKSLEKEMDDIRQFQKECEISYKKRLSFKEASMNYLKSVFPWDL